MRSAKYSVFTYGERPIGGVSTMHVGCDSRHPDGLVNLTLALQILLID
jgi:hypothetical protein